MSENDVGERSREVRRGSFLSITFTGGFFFIGIGIRR
jgi:hypothetical protein